MTAAGSASDLAIELALDRTEAEVHAALAAHAAEHWRRCIGGRAGAPAWPAVLAEEAAWRAAERARRDATAPPLRRRGVLLWRLCARARIDGDAAVRDAAAALRGRAGAEVGDLGALCAARNRAARRLGWDSFHALALALDEVEAAELALLIDGPGRVSGGDRFDGGRDRGGDGGDRRDGVDDGDDRDSDVDDRAAVGAAADGIEAAARCQPAELARRLFGWYGVDGAPRIDLVAKAGARLARTFGLGPADVRVVVAPALGARGLRRTMHELGHAFHAMSWRAQPLAFAAPAARCLDEAIAEWSAGHLEHPAGVAALLDATADEAAAIAAGLRARHRRWQRWQRARAAFERDAYAQPEAALGARFRALAALHAGAHGDAAARDAAAVAPYIDDPGAQASYLVADALRARLEALDPRAARAPGCDATVTSSGPLRSLLAAGASHSWRTTLAITPAGAFP